MYLSSKLNIPNDLQNRFNMRCTVIKKKAYDTSCNIQWVELKQMNKIFQEIKYSDNNSNKIMFDDFFAAVGRKNIYVKGFLIYSQ